MIMRKNNNNYYYPSVSIVLLAMYVNLSTIYVHILFGFLYTIPLGTCKEAKPSCRAGSYNLSQQINSLVKHRKYFSSAVTSWTGLCQLLYHMWLDFGNWPKCHTRPFHFIGPANSYIHTPSMYSGITKLS